MAKWEEAPIVADSPVGKAPTQAMGRDITPVEDGDPGVGYYVNDMIKGFGSGAVDAVEGIIGAPGDVFEGAVGALNWADRQINPNHVDVPPLGLLPTSSDWHNLRQRVGLTPHEPKTEIGQVTTELGRFAPVAVASPGKYVTSALLPAVGSWGGGYLTRDTSLEPYGKLAGALAGVATPAGLGYALKHKPTIIGSVIGGMAGDPITGVALGRAYEKLGKIGKIARETARETTKSTQGQSLAATKLIEQQAIAKQAAARAAAKQAAKQAVKQKVPYKVVTVPIPQNGVDVGSLVGAGRQSAMFSPELAPVYAESIAKAFVEPAQKQVKDGLARALVISSMTDPMRIMQGDTGIEAIDDPFTGSIPEEDNPFKGPKKKKTTNNDDDPFTGWKE